MTVHVLALMSPGPDFAVVVRVSLTQTRRVALLCALGIALAISVHLLYSLVGISLIISEIPLLFKTIQFLGALYLIWIGVSIFRTHWKQKATASNGPRAPKLARLSDLSGFRLGFLTNLLNPKATLFFLSVFTQFISSETPNWVKGVYGLAAVLTTGLWFGFLAWLLTVPGLHRRIQSVQGIIEKIMALVLLALGVRILVLL